MAAMYSRPYQVAVTAKTTPNSAMIAAWLVVIEYRLCRCRHNLYYADFQIMPTSVGERAFVAVMPLITSA